MFLKLRDVGVDAAGELSVVVLVDGGVVHVPPGQVLGQDFKKYVVLVLHDGLVDATLHKGPGGDDLSLVQLRQLGHPLQGRPAEEQALHLVVVGEALVPPGGVKNPIPDVHQVQQTAKLLLVQLQIHGGAPPLRAGMIYSRRTGGS